MVIPGFRAFTACVEIKILRHVHAIDATPTEPDVLREELSGAPDALVEFHTDTNGTELVLARAVRAAVAGPITTNRAVVVARPVWNQISSAPRVGAMLFPSLRPRDGVGFHATDAEFST